MSHWDVSDVVQLLKTFGATRDTQIFVFRHNIDGATMDESVELLVKDFRLDDVDLESKIVSKWKDISSKGLLPKDVLDRDANGKVIQSPSKPAVTPITVLNSNNISEPVQPKPAEATKPTLTVVSGKPEEKTSEDSEPPTRAQFTHLKSAKWSRSGKFSPRSLQIEEEPSNTDDSSASKPEEVKQETSVAKVESPFHRPPMAWSPSFKRSVKVFRFDDDTVIEIPAEGDDVVAPAVVPEPIPAALPEPQPKQEAVVVAEQEPVVEILKEKEVEIVAPARTEEIKVQTEQQPQSAPTTEENTYDLEDWEAELDELHKHSVVDESPELPRTSPIAGLVLEDDTVGFEKSIAEEISIPDTSQQPTVKAELQDHDIEDMVDPDLDAIIAKQTEEYHFKVASSKSPFHSPSKPHNHNNTNSSTTKAASEESEIIQKYQADLQKQAELLRLQQEQILLQRQLIEQQRRDLTAESPRRTPKSLKSHTRSHKRDKASKGVNNSNFPVRAGVEFANTDLDDGAEPFYTDNGDAYYAQAPTAPSMLYDSISMLSDSGVFDATYHNNIPFPGVFMPESSITSANSGEYEAVYRKPRDLSPSPHGTKRKIFAADGGATNASGAYNEPHRAPHRPYMGTDRQDSGLDSSKQSESPQRDNGYAYYTTLNPENRGNESPEFRFTRKQEVEEPEQQYGEVLTTRNSSRAPGNDLAQGSTDSAGHVWHHMQSATSRFASRPHVPVLQLGAVQEQATPPQRQQAVAQGPESSSPLGSKGVPDAALADLMNVLKELALTNAKLTEALRPTPAAAVPPTADSAVALVSVTSRSAPASSGTAGRGRRGPFIGGEGTAPPGEANQNHGVGISGRPEWDPHHTDDAAQALATARTEPRGRPKSRESTSSNGVRILRASSRGRSRNGSRPKRPKPALTDYLDLLAKEFAARPLCQAPYYTSNVTFNVQQNTRFDVHPVHNNSHSSKPVLALAPQYFLNQALDEDFHHPSSRPFEQFNRSASPKSAISSRLSSPKSLMSPRSPKSPKSKKGGFIFLDQGPTELQYEGPHYAAPQDRSVKNLHAQEPRSAQSSPGRRPVSRGPDQMVARPASAIGIVGSAPYGPAVPLVSAPPVSSRPSTGNNSRNKARALRVVV